MKTSHKNFNFIIHNSIIILSPLVEEWESETIQAKSCSHHRCVYFNKRNSKIMIQARIQHVLQENSSPATVFSGPAMVKIEVQFVIVVGARREQI